MRSSFMPTVSHAGFPDSHVANAVLTPTVYASAPGVPTGHNPEEQ